MFDVHQFLSRFDWTLAASGWLTPDTKALVACDMQSAEFWNISTVNHLPDA